MPKNTELDTAEESVLDSIIVGDAGRVLLKWLTIQKEEMEAVAIELIKGDTEDDELSGKKKLLKSDGVSEIIDMVEVMADGLAEGRKSGS